MNREERFWGFRNQTDQNKFIKGINHIIKACVRSGIESLNWTGSTDEYDIDIHLKKKEKKDEQGASE